MAEQAQCAEIVEVALAAALGNRQNVICIPKSLPDAFRHAPMTQQVFTFDSACVPELAPLNNGIELTRGADAAIAQEDLFAKVRRLSPQAPLVNAVRGAEREPAARHFERTPPT
jgi:hypothetical protein